MKIIERTQKLTARLAHLVSKKDKVQWVRIEDLKIDGDFRKLYIQEPEKVKKIAEDMKANGYDISQPIIVTTDMTVIDGHSRREAAILAGITEVPVIVKEFASKDETLAYMEHLQLDRRNLTESEKMIHLENLLRLKGQAKKDGKDTSDFTDEKIAAEIKVSTRQVQKMKEVEAKATAEQLDAIRSNRATIAQVHAEIKRKEGLSRKPPEKKPDLDSFKKGIETALSVLKGKLSEQEFSSVSKTLVAECLALYNKGGIK